MTLVAPKSRRGRLSLALVVFLALAAVAGAMLWITMASAVLPTTTNALNFTASSPQPHGASGVLLYDTHWTTSAAVTAINENVLLEITAIDTANLGPLTAANVACTSVSGGANITWTPTLAAGTATCTGVPTAAQAAAAGTFSIHLLNVTILQGTDNVVGAATTRICTDAVATGGCSNEAAGNIVSLSTATVAVTAAPTATITPPSATNAIGQSEVYTIHFEPGVTCGSDINNDLNRNCLAADLTVSGSGGTVSGWPPPDTLLNTAQNFLVTVTCTGSGTVTLTLANRFEGDPLTETDDVTNPNAVATKTCQTLAAFGDAHIVHVDVDFGSEDAAVGGDNDSGVLRVQDDRDDATGSLHTACLISSAKGAGDQGLITWQISATPGSSATVFPSPAGAKVVLNINGEDPADPPFGSNDDAEANCVQWRSAGVGGQTITATYTPTGELIGWDNPATSANEGDDQPPAPLIKQWNDIDVTRIVAATGRVGAASCTLGDGAVGCGNIDQNQATTDVSNWAQRDCSTVPADPGFCTNANLDGQTVIIGGLLLLPSGEVLASGRTFIEYAFGNHAGVAGIDYDGPVDGVQQTFSVSAASCGSVRLEDPSDRDADGNTVEILFPGQSFTILTSDKGVAFQVLPTDDGSTVTTAANADCLPGETIAITITSREDLQLRSDLDTAPAEAITLQFVVGPPSSKTPILAWAGQRVVVEHNWRGPDPDGTGELLGDCPWPDLDDSANAQEFGVLYTKQSGPGSFTAQLVGSNNDIDLTTDAVIVDVDRDPIAGEPNSDCISRIIFEAEDQGEVDISAFVVDEDDDLDEADPRSQQVAFVIFYMKLEDVTLGLVPGRRAGFNTGAFTPANPVSNADDTTEVTVNKDTDVLARVRVRGWVLTDNCPARDAQADAIGLLKPANRCIFPDDWEAKAGGPLAEEFRANMDIMREPTVAGLTCAAKEAGPFSLLDPTKVLITDVPSCTDSKAPGLVTGGFRETVLDDDDVDRWDAPMPPSLVRLLLSGSGFLRGADKKLIYPANSNPFYVTHIPAEPWISPINLDFSGYQWNSWGSGPKSGLYDFWTDLADSATPVLSQPGNVATGGFKLIKIYTDNHGEAMAFVNGNADLTFDDCLATGDVPFQTDEGDSVVFLNGFFCQDGDVVGTATLNAVADYPDKRKHPPLPSNEVDLEFTFGGIKDVDVVAGVNPQFNFVVLQVTDQAGLCNPTHSLHPVFGERVTFQIVSTGGVFADVPGSAGASPVFSADRRTVSVVTFDANSITDAFSDAFVRQLLGLAAGATIPDVCLAFAQVVSLLQPGAIETVKVLTTAENPFGTVTFETVFNPQPTPTPTATPTATPTVTPTPTQTELWADVNCDGKVDPTDSLIVLQFFGGLTPAVPSDCPATGETLSVTHNATTENHKWGDVDCDGDVDPTDSLKILQHFGGLDVVQIGTCPDPGDGVGIPVQT